jgi:hypothetical protein
MNYHIIFTKSGIMAFLGTGTKNTFQDKSADTIPIYEKHIQAA